MKIGLLGGSFNPAHLGHIYISKLALQKLNIKQVWWIPTAHNPLKNKSDYVPFATRFADCLEITKNHPKIHVKNFEKDSISTFKLIRKIRAKHRNIEFVWIMGSDNLHRFHQWDNFKRLIKSINFAIFSRDLTDRKAAKYHKKYFANFLFFKTKNYDISSTKLRNLSTNQKQKNS